MIMIYEVKIKLNEEEFRQFDFQNAAFVNPLYKKECDDQEKDWIVSHSEVIGHGIVASYVYELYWNDFIDKKVVAKTKFYKACREILGLEMKRISIENETKYCFIKSQDESSQDEFL